MTNTNDATLPTHSILEECTAMAVVNALKIILKNSYAIYLKTKNATRAHPNVINFGNYP